MEFKVKKRLTLPLFKLAEGIARYVKITGEMHLGKEQPAVTDKDGKEIKAKKEAATLVPCINLEDGVEGQIILSAVVKSILTDEYPGGKYVNKCFAITKQGRAVGKSYNSYDVQEIEDPTAEREAAAPVSQHPASRGGVGRR